MGDEVSMDVIDEKERLGNIVKLWERKNELIRPAVANVDQALVIFAAAAPEPNLGLLDRFLIRMERAEVPTVICFNKEDLITEEKKKRLAQIYESAGYQVIFTSALLREGLTLVEKVLKWKVTTVAGPSGAG